jgi:WD40 repeat protein
MTGERLFRVFVSSTFSDLVAERNALQEHVFPPLRRLCAEQGAQFQAVDLRWGVSEEASLDQQAVTICLEEVARCQAVTPRPNFVLLLGDRYGWCPLPPAIPGGELAAILDQLPEAARERITNWYRLDSNAVPPRYLLQPRQGRFANDELWAEEERALRAWLRAGAEAAPLDEAQRLKFVASVTEQEVTAGLPDGSGTGGRAFCFLRTIESLPADATAAGFRDLDQEKAPDGEAADRLRQLKGRLRTTLGQGSVFEYTARWNGSGPTLGHLPQLCQDVYAALARVIQAELAGMEQIDPLDREVAEHDRFGRDRSRAFLGRDAALERVDRYLAGESGGPLGVIGASGSGKTALMGQAIARARRALPPTRVLERFIGATPRSADARTLLQDLCRQLVRLRGGDEADLPVGYRDLADRFRRELELGGADGRLVLFLDALDQLGHDRGLPDLSWLPARLPPTVRMIVSVTDGPLGAVVERRFPDPPLALEPMPPAEGAALLDRWLTAAARTLQPHQRREVLNKFGVQGLPLYLRLAFQEAVRWPSYLPADQTALSPTIPGIIGGLIDRLSSQQNHGPMLVNRSLGYLAASRNGLAEDELLDVLSDDDEVLDNFKARSPRSPDIGRRLPTVVWSRLSFDLAPYLSGRRADGKVLLAFYHRQLAEEVSRRCLGDGQGRERHRALARYFPRQGQELGHDAAGRTNPRLLSELPYQQTLGELWQDLFATLTDFGFLEAKVTGAGVEERRDADGRPTRTYTGPFLLQDDFGLALARWPVDAAPPAPRNGRAVLAAFSRAVAREATTLASRPEATWQQLANRLQWAGADVLAAIGSELHRRTTGKDSPWLRLRTRFPESEALVRALPADNQWAFGCAIDAAGSLAASVGADGVVKLWDLGRGELRFELPQPHGIATGCAVSPDGTLVCATSADGTARIWDTEDGTERATLQGHRDSANACALGPDGRLLVSVGSDGTLRFWNTETAVQTAVLTAHDGVVSACAVSPDGSLVVSAGRDGAVKVWDAATARLQVSWLGQYPVLACAAGPAGTVAAGYADGTLRLWDVAGGSERARIGAHDGETKGCAVSADGTLLVSAGGDATVKLWDATDASLLATLSGHTMDVEACALSRDGSVLISAGGDGALRVWDPTVAGLRPGVGGHRALVWGCEFTRRGDLAASGGEDGTLALWDVRSGAARATAGTEPAAPIKDCAITPDDRLVVTARDDGEVALFELPSGQETAALSGHVGAVNACAAFPDAGFIMSAGRDGTCRIWDAGACAEVALLSGHTDQVWHCAVSPDESFVVSASHDGTLRLWQAGSWTTRGVLTGHHGQVWHCAISPDATLVASAGSDHTARLWSATSGQPLHILHGHHGAVTRCAFTPDGHRLVTASIDHSIGVWDVRSGRHLSTLEGHAAPVWAFGLSPSGRFLVSGGHDGTVVVWDLTVGSALAAIPVQARVWCVTLHPRDPIFACGGAGGLLHLVEVIGTPSPGDTYQ